MQQVILASNNNLGFDPLVDVKNNKKADEKILGLIIDESSGIGLW